MAVGTTGEALTASIDHVVPWGDKTTQLGLIPAGIEKGARGPAAVAVGARDEVLVLDAVNRRVVRVTGGEVETVAGTPADAVDLGVGDGVVGVLGALTGRVSLFDASGDSAGQVAVPALLRDVDGFRIGASRRVVVSSAMQERWIVGGPSVPMPIEVALATKREGAVDLPDGRGVAVVHTDQGIELRVLASSAERTRVDARSLVAPGAGAAHVVGAVGNVVCMRLETASQPSGAIDVKREVLCANAVTGATLFRHDLPPVDVYLPRRELAFGGATGTLAFVHPEPAGLHVVTWTVGGGR